jgi:glutathione S-transferase
VDSRAALRYDGDMPKPTLIYFAGRGRAEVIRLALAEAGVEFEEHHVGRGTPLANGRSTDLAALKAEGVLPFGAVPVWEEPGGLRLAQSAAILNHLGRQHGLRGASALEEARCDELLGAVEDVRGELRKLLLAAPGERADVRRGLEERVLPRWFGDLERLLAPRLAATGFAVGASLTVADLALWYLLETVRDNGMEAAFGSCPALVAFAARVAARPRIAAYLASSRRPAFTPFPR